MKFLSAQARALSAVALLLGLTACSRSTRIRTNAAGHAITAELEGDHSIDTASDRAVINSQYGRVTVERTRVQIGDQPWTTIPEGVAVKVGISKHKRWISTGSITVKETFR